MDQMGAGAAVSESRVVCCSDIGRSAWAPAVLGNANGGAIGTCCRVTSAAIRAGQAAGPLNLMSARVRTRPADVEQLCDHERRSTGSNSGDSSTRRSDRLLRDPAFGPNASSVRATAVE